MGHLRLGGKGIGMVHGAEVQYLTIFRQHRFFACRDDIDTLGISCIHLFPYAVEVPDKPKNRAHAGFAAEWISQRTLPVAKSIHLTGRGRRRNPLYDL